MNNIMKKNYLFLATAIVALASCSDNTYFGENESGGPDNMPISFNMSTPAMTRTENTGKDAATALSNRFIVWGEKNETNGDAASAVNLVFKNYKVEWTDNSAYKTTSNTQNWEYVGLTPYAANVTPVISEATQTIKYWDYNATSYTFTAVSALDADVTSGKVVITKNTSGSTVYDKGYDIAVKTDASLGNIYIADRNQPTKGTGTDRDASNAYGGNVKMTFRSFMSKIRFGIYENIPGYKVKITNVDYNSTNSTATSKFGVDGKFLVAGANTAFTVTYESSGTNINKAKAVIKDGTTPNSVTYLETAQSVAESPILNSTPTEIATSPTLPTYDKTDGAYTTILPFPSNDTNMKIMLDFTLTSEDTGETINVVDATAEIPASYCQWLPNYAYTYILKLNDNTNGQIGGVTGLYPITFDAIQVTDENGVAEYITTVSEPSITTFGVKSGEYSVEKADYETGTDIYATIVKNHAVVDPTSNYYVYTVTAGATEAQVAEAIAEKAIRGVTPDITCTSYTTNVSIVTSVPTEDGSTKTVTGAIKMENPAAATYAVAYKVSAGSATATTADYNASATYYSMTPTAEGFYQKATPTSEQIAEWATAKANFTTAPTQPVYVYKVIKIVTAP